MEHSQRPIIDRTVGEIFAWCSVLFVLGTLLAIDLIKFGQLNHELMGWLGGVVAATLARGAVPALLPSPKRGEISTDELEELRELRALTRERLAENLRENTGEIRRLSEKLSDRSAIVEEIVDDDPTRRSR